MYQMRDFSLTCDAIEKSALFEPILSRWVQQQELNGEMNVFMIIHEKLHEKDR